MALPTPRPPFVLDADCIIKLARQGLLRSLPSDERTIIIPFKVDEEIRGYRGRRSLVKEWLNKNNHLVKRFQTPEEHELYYALIAARGHVLGEGEAAGIAMANRRNGTFVSDDRKAREIASLRHIVSITPAEFHQFVLPRLGM